MESPWAAGAVAFVAHSVLISACALGMACFKDSAQPALTNHFLAEMVFVDGSGKKELEIPSHSSPAALPRSLPQGERYKQPVHFSSPLRGRSSPEVAGERGHPCPLYNPPPVYPLEARRRKMQGVVLVRLSLTGTGEVSQATPLPPRIGFVLEEAALTAVYKWRFKPGVATVEVPIEFRLVG